MPEYNLEFAKKLLESGEYIYARAPENLDNLRAALYLSKLSVEIALKFMLERAGMPVGLIVSRGHDLSSLLDDFGVCEVYIDIVGLKGKMWVRGTRIRAIRVDDRFSNATIGRILQAEKRGASKYPNKIRYGEELIDYPVEVWLRTGSECIAWGDVHKDSIRFRQALYSRAAQKKKSKSTGCPALIKD